MTNCQRVRDGQKKEEGGREREGEREKERKKVRKKVRE